VCEILMRTIFHCIYSFRFCMSSNNDFVIIEVILNMVLRRIFGPRRDEVMWEWRRLHKEELNDLYS